MDRLGAVLDYAAAQGKEIRAVNLMVEKNIPAVFVDPALPEPEAGGPAQPEPKPEMKPAAKPTPSPAPKAPAKPLKKKTETPVQTVKRNEAPVHRVEAAAPARAAEPAVRRAEPPRNFCGVKF